jgi:sulfur-oxidizing protein SoxY
MAGKATTNGLTRRGLLKAGSAVSAGLAGIALIPPGPAEAGDEALDFVGSLIGRTLAISDRLHLTMPTVFPSGYTVPMAIAVDSPMTEADHVRYVRVFAPKNPIIEIAAFRFAPQRCAPSVSTRVRLAAPQFVVAVAELNDETLLAAKTWVDVASNGCV